MRPRLLGAIAALALAMTVFGVGAPAAYASGASILGGGSGFAALEMDQWRADTARSPFNLTVNYVSQGSTFGRQQFSGGSFDYGASDIPYQQVEIPDLESRRCNGKPQPPDNRCFVYVPVSAGGLAFMYNLVDNSGNRITNLKLTRQAACKIFTGAITKWNDPEIVATNPQFRSFARNIKPIVRTDGAGESYVFSEFCIAVAPTVWRNFVNQQRTADPELTPEFLARQPTSVWPQQAWGVSPVGVATADGTAGYVADPTGGPNAITYVAAGYAQVRSFPTASIQNAAGVFTQPDEENVTVALGYATPRGNGTFQLAFNGPDPRAYFPSTYSYVLAQTAGFDPSKGATLGHFLCYAVSQGQADAPQLRYARLSSALVNIAINAIVQIPGAPSAANCPVAGAPPPPPPVNLCSNCGVGTTTTVPGQQTSSGPGETRSGLSAKVVNPRGTVTAGNCATPTRPATASTTTTRSTSTTTVPCVRIIVGPVAGGVLGSATFGGTAARTRSLDADLAREAHADTATHGSSDWSLWILVAGAAAMFALTTALSRRGSTT
jgi:phosphate transport system substrate-binding protein